MVTGTMGVKISWATPGWFVLSSLVMLVKRFYFKIYKSTIVKKTWICIINGEHWFIGWFSSCRQIFLDMILSYNCISLMYIFRSLHTVGSNKTCLKRASLGLLGSVGQKPEIFSFMHDCTEFAHCNGSLFVIPKATRGEGELAPRYPWWCKHTWAILLCMGTRGRAGKTLSLQ